eukprot:PhF_6_TR20538/c0_g1_i3/m.29647/K01517/ADPRM; manganese-dependent ADP-ribose/CDP-alcohol diphosphatase
MSRKARKRNKEDDEQHPTKTKTFQTTKKTISQMIGRIGLIADIQYADVPNVTNFDGSKLRYYRNALSITQRAARYWTHMEDGVVPNLIIQAGDIIDARNKDTQYKVATETLHKVYKELEQVGVPIVNLIGNHELYNFTRNDLVGGIGSFSCSQDGKTYYRVMVAAKTRLIVLDGYVVSPIREGGGRHGVEYTSRNMEPVAYQMMKERNPNDMDRPGVNFFHGLKPGPEHRWVPFNGGLGPDQLSWLDSELADAATAGDIAILTCHAIFHPGATSDGKCQTLLWDYEEALAIVNKYGAAVVPLVLCGHAHDAAVFVDPDSGVEHITLPSPIEVAKESDECFGVLDVYKEKLMFRWRGPGFIPTMRCIVLGRNSSSL